MKKENQQVHTFCKIFFGRVWILQYYLVIFFDRDLQHTEMLCYIWSTEDVEVSTIKIN